MDREIRRKQSAPPEQTAQEYTTKANSPVWASSSVTCNQSKQLWLSKQLSSPFMTGWFEASLRVFTVLICGRGAVSSVWLSSCSKRNHKRNGIALKGSYENHVWVHRLLVCRPGALKPYLSKCSKRNHRRNKLVLHCLFESTLWALRVLICGDGALSSAWANVVREAIEGMG